LNIVFDPGGVVSAWEPEKIIVKVSTDPQVRLSIHREISEQGDWRELDRGTGSELRFLVEGITEPRAGAYPPPAC